MPNTLSPTPQNLSYSANVNIPQSYSISGFNGLTGILTPHQKTPTELKFTTALDVELTFSVIENGKDISMLFQPEHDLTVMQLQQVMLLSAAASSGIIMYSSDVLAYVRKHNLERHFKFTVV